MTRYSALCYIFLLTFLKELIITQMSLHDNGFIQSTNEVRYFMDDISTIHKEFSTSGVNIQTFEELQDGSSKPILKFDPEILDFKERHLGVPHHEKVTVINVNSNKTVVMTSISGNTVHFHSSFFEDKIIPPLGNTTFNVVFLGRQEGSVESVLLIHTSEGSVKYKVKGLSEASPYRLRPLVGIRLPLNASFSPLIYMHNPHSTAIQVIEVYSSGGEFHLELPTGELEGPKHMWEIPPHQTRPVIRVRFNARLEANHTSYVRIKLNNSQDVLVVPLEVEVGPFPGLYTPQGGIDFGVGGTLDQSQKLKLLLHNTWKKPIRIQNIIAEIDDGVVSIDFQPIKVPPNAKIPIQVAMLTINWKVAFEMKHFSGRLLVRSKQVPYDMVIPYWASVMKGGLLYNTSVTQFLFDKGSPDLVPRNFTVKNLFDMPLAVTNITVPVGAQSYFIINNFSRTVIQSKETVTLFIVQLKSTNTLSDLSFESDILIHTNISTVKVPFLSYNGKLKKIIPYATAAEKVLDFGLVSVESQRQVHLFLVNSNPTDVLLENWSTDLKGAVVHLLGCSAGNATSASFLHKFENLTDCKVLRPAEYAVFAVRLVAPKTECHLWGEVMIKTQFEHITTPVTVRVALGKFEVGPDRLVFDECFPGKICTHPLKVHSSFNRGLDVIGITSVPPDPCLGYKTVTTGRPHIAPRTTRIVALVSLDPAIQCTPHCYTGLSINSTVGVQWLGSFTLSYSVRELDLDLLNTRFGRYANFTMNGLSRWQNITLRLDTNEVKGHVFTSRVKMSWPKLLTGSALTNKSVFLFPLTQIGNTSYQTITFRNPSARNLVLQLVMDSVYPQAKALLEDLPNVFLPGCLECSDAPPSMFFFAEKHKHMQEDFQKEYNISSHQDSLPLTIAPGQSVNVTIGFAAIGTSVRSALLFVRNNLTVLEVVRIVGQGAHPVLKFGNRRPGSTTPLLFELTEKHLKDCEREKNRKNPSPNLTVKRSFTARNTGDIPISIDGFYIDGYPCEGFGFKVLDCEPFRLLPNATKKVDVAFTPDFTLAKIQRMLIIDTSLNIPVNYTLVTTVPPYFLATCSSVLARPSWESLLYYTSVSFMIFLLFCVLIGAFLESDRIIQCAFVALSRDTGPLQAPLDLRSVGAQTRSEIRLHKSDVDVDFTNSTVRTQNNNKTNVLDKVDNSIRNDQEKRSKDSNVSIPRSILDTTVSPCRVSNIDTSTNKNQKVNIIAQKYDVNTNCNNGSALLPSAKAKKKVGKRNSSGEVTEIVPDVVQETVNDRKKTSSVSPKVQPLNRVKSKNISPTSTVNLKKVKSDEEPQRKKVVEVQKDLKKVGITLKKNKHIESICSEEETSSTTTESSNNDDGDKEIVPDSVKREKNKKSSVKKNKVIPASVDYRDSYEGDGEDDEYEKLNERSPNEKTVWKHSQEVKVTVKVDRDPSEIYKSEKDAVIPKTKINRNCIRDRKDKTVQKKQRVVDKNSNSKSNNNQDLNITKNCMLSTPTAPPPNCWGENRASFSDVVARSDSNLYSSILASKEPAEGKDSVKRQRALPVEFKTESVRENEMERETGNVELGPIGTKKSPVNTWESVPDSQLVKPQFTSSFHQNRPQFSSGTDSFFMNGTDYHSARPTENRCQPSRQNVDDLFSLGADWNPDTSILMNLLHNTTSMLADYPQQPIYPSSSWSGSNSVWGDSLYSSLAVGEERQQLQQQQISSSRLGNASSAWDATPWTSTTLAPGTPTRTPPGFQARPPLEQNVDRTLGFDPFRSSFGDIWTPPRTHHS